MLKLNEHNAGVIYIIYYIYNIYSVFLYFFIYLLIDPFTTFRQEDLSNCSSAMRYVVLLEPSSVAAYIDSFFHFQTLLSQITKRD